MSASLSLAMTVKNEEQVLGRVLEAARIFCDELIVVDTGSTDQTVAVAESFGARVCHFEWIDDFAAARNYAFSHCTGDWIIWLDADDVIPASSQALIRTLMQDSGTIPEAVNLITCSYDIAFDSEGRTTIRMPRERIIRRACGGQWRYPIHEAFVAPSGSLSLDRPDIRIEHHKPAVYVERSSDRNLTMLARLLANGERDARILYYYGKELKAHQRLEEAIAAFQDHLAVNPQPDAARYQALVYMAQCGMELERLDEARQWLMQAIDADSGRAEAFTELGVLYYRQQDFARAVPLLTAATVCRRPSVGSIAEADYSWRPWHYLSLCREGLGEPQQAIEAALAAWPTIPDRDVLIRNIQCFTGKLGQ